MENKPKVSVIVPVYNVEKYLNKCVDSIIKQTLKEIEIILVDDGSTDSSAEMCDRYISIDSRIRVVHKTNGGLSSARNEGIKVAKADYIGFVDSDDYIDEDMYEVLYKAVISEEADVAFCGMYNCYTNAIKVAYNLKEGYFIKNKEELIRDVLEGKIASVSAPNKLFKKELLGDDPFPFGKTFEDAHFIIPFLLKVDKGVLCMEPKYYYVHHNGTITTSMFHEKDLSIIEAYENNKSLVEENCPGCLQAAYFRCYWSHFYVLDKIYRMEDKSHKDTKKLVLLYLRKNYFNIMRNPLVGRGRKIALSGLMIHESLYKVFLFQYNKRKKQLFD